MTANLNLLEYESQRISSFELISVHRNVKNYQILDSGGSKNS